MTETTATLPVRRSRNPGGVGEAGVAFAAAHADGRPHRAFPQKPKLESFKLGSACGGGNNPSAMIVGS